MINWIDLEFIELNATHSPAAPFAYHFENWEIDEYWKCELKWIQLKWIELNATHTPATAFAYHFELVEHFENREIDEYWKCEIAKKNAKICENCENCENGENCESPPPLPADNNFTLFDFVKYLTCEYLYIIVENRQRCVHGKCGQMKCVQPESEPTSLWTSLYPQVLNRVYWNSVQCLIDVIRVYLNFFRFLE